ncbi:MAG: CDP-diacylglycerol--serine O-phosphatidyltransferase [Ectothiorhodospiraceae bacterium]|nr:CDP-diacylglycerol--serine O-phosphatidyltransferase [Ectothiorhodospiraceae bacterium]
MLQRRFRNVNIDILKALLPNAFTVLNIMSGFLSIAFSFNGDFVTAAWFIVASALLDATDGIVARALGTSSDFGVELDSLADVTSFGVAPSVFVYVFFLQGYGIAGAVIASLQLVCGALRLARFNIQLTSYVKRYFIGMPIPLSALILVSSVFLLSQEELLANQAFQYVFMSIIIVNSALMISSVRYPIFPRFTPREFREKPMQMYTFIGGGIFIILTMGKALFPFLLLIGLAGPISLAVKKIVKPVSVEDQGFIRDKQYSEAATADT